ncbi:MAG: CreA family protein [Pseudomonadales bacterium]
MLLISGLLISSITRAELVGTVRTAFNVVGANDKIVIEAFDDPIVPGVSCYLSRATTGGISGSVGLAEDPVDAAIACKQTGSIVLRDDIKTGKRDGEEVFKISTSLLFKTIQVVRFYDAKRNTLVYLSYSNKLIDGSPKNSVSAVPVRP